MDTLLGVVLIGVGIWSFISPQSAFSFKAKLAKMVGVKMTASPKAYQAFKYIGLALAIAGLFLFLN